MYQLIIADDEKIIRQGLKNVVNWENIGFEIAEIFSDGQEVIEYLDYMKADVILTDIKMTHVSGIDVARYVFEHNIKCKVVLISGYQEFDLALQGMKYGAKDYLLKPTNVDNIIDTFSKIKEELDCGREMESKDRAQKERMDEALPMIEERFFSDVVLGVVDSEKYIKNRMHVLYPDIDIDQSTCIIVDMRILDYEQYMNNIWEYSYDQFEINLSNFFRIFSENISLHIVYKSKDVIELFGIFLSGINDETDIKHLLDRLIEELNASFNTVIKYTLKHIYKNIFEIIDSKNTLYGEFCEQENISGHMIEQKKLLMSNISLGNIVSSQKIFHSIIEELAQAPALYRNNIVIDILSTMNTVIKEVNSKLCASLQNYFNYSVILSYTDNEDIKSYCDRIFDRIKLAEEKKEYYDANSLISKAKNYIMENIDKDISQEEAANQLYICSSYLSRLFKKQTGENFTQFVTRMKVERAIELLKDPQYKTYQVSEALGYKTPRYFSRLFRLQTGMNPSEYRGKVLKVGGDSIEN